MSQTILREFWKNRSPKTCQRSLVLCSGRRPIGNSLSMFPIPVDRLHLSNKPSEALTTKFDENAKYAVKTKTTLTDNWGTPHYGGTF